jgi:hypothetical protein
MQVKGSHVLLARRGQHMVVAWLAGGFMAWLAESYRRCTFANQQAARDAHFKELEQKSQHLAAQQELAAAREEVCISPHNACSTCSLHATAIGQALQSRDGSCGFLCDGAWWRAVHGAGVVLALSCIAGHAALSCIAGRVAWQVGSMRCICMWHRGVSLRTRGSMHAVGARVRSSLHACMHAAEGSTRS